MNKSNKDGENNIYENNKVNKKKNSWKTNKAEIMGIMEIMGRSPDCANK